MVGHAQVLSQPCELPICLPDIRQWFAVFDQVKISKRFQQLISKNINSFFKSSPVYVVAKQGCNAHVGKAVSLQPRLQLLLGDIRGDEQVGVHIIVEHPRWLEGGDHNAQTSWQCVHLDQLLDRWPESFSKVFLVTVSGVLAASSVETS